MKILGIESSCDETSAAVIEIDEQQVQVLSNVIASQGIEHRQYGGVVPEVAARRHAANIFKVINGALERLPSADPADLDLIAVTRGPGLMTSLLVGVQAAEVLGLAWEKPVVGVNHLEGHVLSPLLDHDFYPLKPSDFPLLALTVSGGHTQLVLMTGPGRNQTIGTTIDDAAGEAFDKVAKMLGLPYPGGPHIDRLAARGNPSAFDFPRPMLHTGDLNFSFSGLKTAVRYAIRDLRVKQLTEAQQQDIAASFQRAVTDVLLEKTWLACRQYAIKTLFIAGGVAANQELRARAEQEAPDEVNKVAIVHRRYSGDNAAMIALAGYFEYQRQNKKPREIEVDPKLPLGQ